MGSISYLYLHGFASGITSRKAQFFLSKLRELNQELILVDFNQDDFSNLTITRQLEQIRNIIKDITNNIVLIGSSMGGLIATLIAQESEKVVKTILLAPAFEMSTRWSEKMSKDDKMQWQQKGEISVYHYEYLKEIPLKYKFFEDLQKYDTKNFTRQINSLIFHGRRDDVVPIEVSYDYINCNQLATLVVLNDDHSLLRNLDTIWENIKNY